MKARILPPEEWSRLIGTEAELVWPQVDSLNADVLVVEDGDEIVGTWMFLKVVHAECFWISPKHKASFAVGKRLIQGLRDQGKKWGVASVITGSVDPHVTDMIERFGGKPMPCESFILPVVQRKVQDLERGREFHRQLEAQIPDNHPEDKEHDAKVGKALRRAIEDKKPVEAVEEYNAWARRAGYEPISYLGTVDGRMRADIVSAVIEVDELYHVHVMKFGEDAPCRL